MGAIIVRFPYTKEDDGTEVLYNVVARVHRPVAEISSGHPDQRAPASGGEVEDVEVYTETNDRVPDEFLELLGIDIQDLEDAAHEHAFGEWSE